MGGSWGARSSFALLVGFRGSACWDVDPIGRGHDDRGDINSSLGGDESSGQHPFWNNLYCTPYFAAAIYLALKGNSGWTVR
ncbi:hypothetical protein F5Y06DRAFT_279875 [Hypoxylon sp. FL0890]|nr:hypothetical protein F5Y06DRAFT_279875 [Hypoxylon sp. FL0890]